eukprot:4414024-Prymnesium_polylepis.1
MAGVRTHFTQATRIDRSQHRMHGCLRVHQHHPTRPVLHHVMPPLYGSNVASPFGAARMQINNRATVNVSPPAQTNLQPPPSGCRSAGVGTSEA